MINYIPADQLKAEIKRLKEKNRPLIFASASQVSMEAGIKQETYNEILAILDSLQDHQVADEVMDNEEKYETLLRDISISTEGQDKVDKIIIL